MANQIIQSIKTIAQSLVDNAGYDKTRGGFIVGVNTVTNTYSVKVDGVTYPIVRAVDGATYNVGDVVKVVIPCNQATQMYIASSVLSDNSLGNKIANAVGLAQDAAKVATNYIEQDDTDGLIFGDKTSGTWSGYHSQILSDRFNILDESSTVLASFGTTTVIGEEAKANMHLTFNNLSMVDKDGTKFFEVGDNRNADGIATVKYTEMVVADSAGTATVTVNSYISSIVSVYADSVQLSSSEYSFNNETVTINGFTANSVKYIEITYTTRDSTIYLTIGSRETSGNIGNYSIAEGRGVIASGDASHAEGTGTTASGVDSHAEGWGTEAIGSDSHAEGFITNATGDCSHAEGNNTTASGWVSHAEGEGTVASGEFSHAGGGWTVADGDYMTAIGQLNTKNSGKAFVIGNGTSDTARSDAFTVDWSGNTVMKGGVTLGTALSIANGGTDANNAKEALANLGGVSMKSLWTNARPTSDFAEQTIPLILNGYEYVLVRYLYSTNYQSQDQIAIVKVGRDAYLTFTGAVSTNIYLSQRTISVGSVSVTFGAPVYKTCASTSNPTTNNKYCIPVEIIGIKGVQ